MITLGVSTTTSGLVTCDTTDSDADLGQCFTNMFLGLNSTWSSGIPALNIPPMDPLGFDGLSADAGSAVVYFEASFSNVTLTGISQFTSPPILVNTTAHTIKSTGVFPLLRLVGEYTTTGHLIEILPPIIHFSGSRGFYVNLVGVKLSVSCQLQNETEGTNTFMALYNCVADLTITDYNFEFHNLGGALLGCVLSPPGSTTEEPASEARVV